MFFVLLNFLKRRLRFLIIFFASFVNQEGSDCLILTFLLGMYLSASSEIRLVMFDAYISISLLFSDSHWLSSRLYFIYLLFVFLFRSTTKILNYITHIL